MTYQENNVNQDLVNSQVESSVVQSIEYKLGDKALVADLLAPTTNVHEEPSANSTVIGTLDTGTQVLVIKEEDNWLQINETSASITGWVFKKLMYFTYARKKARIVSLAQNTTSIRLADIIVGGGSHEYLLDCSSGQTLTVRSYLSRGIPMIESPSGSLVAGDPNSGSSQTWTGTVQENGEYKLIYDSNFKGYVYDFSVLLSE